MGLARIYSAQPHLRDGLASAQWCEAQGLDFIDAYYGCDWGAQLEKPADFPHTPAIYGAQRIKELVSIPVFACPVCHWKFAPETCPGRLQLKRSRRHI